MEEIDDDLPGIRRLMPGEESNLHTDPTYQEAVSYLDGKNKEVAAYDPLIKRKERRRYALLQAAATISTAVYATKDDRIDVEGSIDLAERLLAEIERRLP